MFVTNEEVLTIETRKKQSKSEIFGTRNEERRLSEVNTHRRQEKYREAVSNLLENLEKIENRIKVTKA